MAVRFYVEDRIDYKNGNRYGAVGPYEFIRARAVTDAGQGIAYILKPRDPALGNKTLVFELLRADKFPDPNDGNLFLSGFTFVSLVWKDPKTSALAAQEVLNFLRVTGGPMLLGDQRQFLKRTIVVDGTGWVPTFFLGGMNKGVKDVALIDAAVIANVEKLDGLRIVQAPRNKAYAALLKLQDEIAK